MVRSGAGDPNAEFTWFAVGIRRGYEARPILPANLWPSDNPSATPDTGSSASGGRFK